MFGGSPAKVKASYVALFSKEEAEEQEKLELKNSFEADLGSFVPHVLPDIKYHNLFKSTHYFYIDSCQNLCMFKNSPRVDIINLVTVDTATYGFIKVINMIYKHGRLYLYGYEKLKSETPSYRIGVYHFDFHKAKYATIRPNSFFHRF